MAAKEKTRGADGMGILSAALAVFFLMLIGADVLGTGIVAPIEPIREIETDAVVETDLGQRLDLNLAEVADLEQLPGLGATLARRIIRWRRDHGGFTSVDQLLEVNGIGESKLEAIRDYITVGGE